MVYQNSNFHNTCILGVTPSLLDGKPVIVLATGFHSTTNMKLGTNVLQVFYLREDMHPKEAIKTSEDYSICGDCPLKESNNKVCYVHQGMLGQVYKAYQRSSYPEISELHYEHIKRRRMLLRLGAYGDPAVVPLSMVEKLIEVAYTTVGYTHQWRNLISKDYRQVLQASVETESDAKLAQSQGWKTYRIIKKDAPILENEKLCPWFNQGEAYKQCIDCSACNGRSSNIVAYSSPTKYFNFERYLNSIQ